MYVCTSPDWSSGIPPYTSIGIPLMGVLGLNPTLGPLAGVPLGVPPGIEHSGVDTGDQPSPAWGDRMVSVTGLGDWCTCTCTCN